MNLFLHGNKIEKSQDVFQLEVAINDELRSQTHIEKSCGKAKHKLHALQCITVFKC